MKKFLSFLILFFAFSFNVKAAGLEISMSGVSNINANGSFSVTINATGNDIYGITMALNYDKSKLELTEYTGQSNFTATVGTNIVLDATSGHNGNFKAVVLTFKALSSFTPGQSTKISVSNVKGATTSEVFSGTGASKTITVNIPKSPDNDLSSLTIDGNKLKDFSKSITSYNLGTMDKTEIDIGATVADSKANLTGTGKKQLKYGVNTFNIVVTAENGSKKTYTIKVTRPDNRSSDNTLSNLSISNLDLKFNKNTINYNFTAEHSVSSVTISATANDPKATVTGTGTKKLKNYLNKFSVVVTAENGSKKTYTISINRKDDSGNVGKLSSDNNLKNLTVEGYDISFDKNKLEYTLEVDNSVNNVVVKATASDSDATVEINNINLLSIGSNLITVDVTAEDGNKKTYNLNIIRKSDAPITTIDKLENVLDNSTSGEVTVIVKDDNSIISQNTIQKIKDSGKKVVINKYNSENNIVYSWTVDGTKIKDTIEINTSIKFNSNNFDVISELTNYADAIYLNFEHSGNLPEGTKVKVYVGDRYQDTEAVNIYYFNEKNNKMEKIKMETLVTEGYVEFDIDHCSDYIVTKALVGHNRVNIFMITTILETIILIGIFAYWVYKNKIEKV